MIDWILALLALAAVLLWLIPEYRWWLRRVVMAMLSFALAVENPPRHFDSSRYPKTPAGGWRYFREIVAPAEIESRRQRYM